jgi:hypothetical protein
MQYVMQHFFTDANNTTTTTTVTTTDPNVQQLFLILYILLLIIGLVLAFAGRWVFESLMNILGAIVGGLIGFSFGYDRWGFMGGLLLGMTGAILGGLIFYYIAEFAIAVFCGFLAAAIVILFLGYGYILVAIIVAVVISVICWHFIREIIGVATALLGSIITGVALLGIHQQMGWTFTSGLWILIAILVFVAGAALQVSAVRKGKARERPEPDREKPEPKKKKPGQDEEEADRK